jgi:hypothetical protein
MFFEINSGFRARVYFGRDWIATLIPQRGASLHEFSHAGAVQIREISKVQQNILVAGGQ